MNESVTLLWPDGSATYLPLSEVVGQTIEHNGGRVRPLLVVYEGSFGETEPERQNLIQELRKVGAYCRV